MLYKVVRLYKQSVANHTTTLFELEVFDSHMGVCVGPLGKLEFAKVTGKCLSLIQALCVKVNMFPQVVDVVKPGIAAGLVTHTFFSCFCQPQGWSASCVGRGEGGCLRKGDVLLPINLKPHFILDRADVWTFYGGKFVLTGPGEFRD